MYYYEERQDLGDVMMFAIPPVQMNLNQTNTTTAMTTRPIGNGITALLRGDFAPSFYLVTFASLLFAIGHIIFNSSANLLINVSSGRKMTKPKKKKRFRPNPIWLGADSTIEDIARVLEMSYGRYGNS